MNQMCLKVLRTVVLTAVAAMLSATSPSAHAGARVGEFSIPEVSPLSPKQLACLRELVRTDDEAKAIAAEVEKKAKPLLDAKPNPIEVIHYAGLVNTNPKRIATVAKLREMEDAATLMRYWQLTENKQAAATLRRFISAWFGTYKLTGNDVNENKFYPLLVAYHALRGTFEEAERKHIDKWVEGLGELHAKATRESDHLTNRYTKHVRLTAICGMALDRKQWIDVAHEGVKRFVKESLYKDGSSKDLKRRDTLTYHGSALKPIIELAMLAGEEGEALYTWESPQGGSIKKSVDYVVPYAMGEKKRKEWVNSKVKLDHDRAKAGLDYYKKGKLYDPKNALELMERASYFDPELMRVVRHLTESKAERFPTWQTLINGAAQAAREKVAKQADEG